jgi:MFS family permease
MEVSVGIGYVAGPVFGGIIYNIGGYRAPFIFFAIVQIILSLLIYNLLRKELEAFHESSIRNSSSEENSIKNIISQENLINASTQKEPIIIESEEITYFDVFRNLHIVLNFMILTTSTLNYMYYEPIFSTYLHDEYQVD